MNLETNLQ